MLWRDKRDVMIVVRIKALMSKINLNQMPADVRVTQSTVGAFSICHYSEKSLTELLLMQRVLACVTLNL